MRKPTQAQFDKAAADIAFSYAPEILECQKCGWPHANGYVCGHCGDESPTRPKEEAQAKTYDDKMKCPKGHRFTILRRVGTAGKKVRTYCRMCQQPYQLVAGPVPAPKGSKS